MTARHFGMGSPALHQFLYVLFSPLFYGGVLLTSLGLGIPPIVKAWRRIQLRDRVALVFLTATLGRTYWGLSRAPWLVAIANSCFVRCPSVGLYEYVYPLQRSEGRSLRAIHTYACRPCPRRGPSPI